MRGGRIAKGEGGVRVSEIFYSIQGEGVHAGEAQVFVRLQGCRFRCRWCDSVYTWDPHAGETMTLEAVLDAVAAFPTRRVCITGGEPLAQPRAFAALVRALREREYWMEVETSGGYAIPWHLPIDSWVMDVKCPDSDMERFNKYPEVARLRPQDQLKLVVASRRDFDFALGVIAEHRPQCHVLFSPVWSELQPAALAEWIKAEAPGARLSLQVHKVLWEPNRRGVPRAVDRAPRGPIPRSRHPAGNRRGRGVSGDERGTGAARARPARRAHRHR